MAYLAIDPGSTSTKLAVYRDGCIRKGAVDHPRALIDTFEHMTDQKAMRRDVVNQWLRDQGFSDLPFRAVIGRGGLIRPVPGGVFAVNGAMLDDLATGVNGQHASNLGGLLAHDFARRFHCPALIADPVVVDELAPVARLSGLSGIERKSIFHALNQKAVARIVAQKLGRAYGDLNLIVAHLGGGISVGAHVRGRVTDVNDALSGDGPFSPERTGGLPVSGVAALIRSGAMTPDGLERTAAGKGGVFSYLGITDVRELVSRSERNDERASLVLSGMIYQIAKEIGGLAAAMDGRVDAVVLTGGLAHSTHIVATLTAKIRFIAPVFVEPGEHELEALIDAARRVIEHGEPALTYPPDD
ncbi:butyrate kinase [Desulfatiferula olefinivorans]